MQDVLSRKGVLAYSQRGQRDGRLKEGRLSKCQDRNNGNYEYFRQYF